MELEEISRRVNEFEPVEQTEQAIAQCKAETSELEVSLRSEDIVRKQ